MKDYVQMFFFHSLGESVQDPMVYSLLDLISLLCADQTVPSDAWDFILCALVTITHVRQLFRQLNRLFSSPMYNSCLI